MHLESKTCWWGGILPGQTSMSTSTYRVERIKSYFVSSWLNDLHSGDISIARTYRLYKSSFGTECYLKFINHSKFRVALSNLRTCSHNLDIERGRYVRPKLNVDQRLCLSCNVVEDEEHFITNCSFNQTERRLLYSKMSCKDPCFSLWSWEVSILTH